MVQANVGFGMAQEHKFVNDRLTCPTKPNCLSADSLLRDLRLNRGYGYPKALIATVE